MNGEIKKERNNLPIRNIFFCILVLIPVIWITSFRSIDVHFSPTNKADDVKTSSVRLLIVGDMMLDRNVRNIINKIGFKDFFSGVKDLVEKADISIANLEGTFTPYPSKTASLVSKELIFTFDPNLAQSLSEIGFDILGLANNHSYNFGKEGLEMTRRYIGGAGMLYYGDPFNKDEISIVIVKNGIRIGLVGFHEFYYTDFDKVFFEVARMSKDVDVLIVTPHWGVEYQKQPTEKMVEWAHQFIDYGADAVIGAHPHIIGTSEIYRGKKIYYSLGNFVFDQYFSEATMNGLGIELIIDKTGDNIDIDYREIPIRVDRNGVRK